MGLSVLNPPAAADHNTPLGLLKARTARDEVLSMGTIEGRALAARILVIQRIGSQLQELVGAKHRLLSAACKADSLEKMRALRAQATEFEARMTLLSATLRYYGGGQ